MCSSTLGTGDGAVFGDVAHHHHHGARLLRQPGEKGRSFPHLADAARVTVEAFELHDLYGIQHHQGRRGFTEQRRDGFRAGFGGHLERIQRQAQPARAHGKLLEAFLARDIKHTLTASELGAHLQQQGALTRARLTAEQHHRPRHQAAAQHPVEFVETGFDAGEFSGFHVRQGFRLSQCAAVTLGAAAAGYRPYAHPRQRVPGSTAAALTLPLTVFGAAVGAHVGGFGLLCARCHGSEHRHASESPRSAPAPGSRTW